MKAKTKKRQPIVVRTISYSRIRNIGNYENERVEVSAEMNKGQSPSQVLDGLRKFAESQLNVQESKRSRDFIDDDDWLGQD